MTMDRQLILPADFADYEWEVESKGYFTDAAVRIGQRDVPVIFYEPTRLAQDIDEDLTSGRNFFVARLFVVPRVTRESMLSAVAAAPEEIFG